MSVGNVHENTLPSRENVISKTVHLATNDVLKKFAYDCTFMNSITHLYMHIIHILFIYYL